MTTADYFAPTPCTTLTGLSIADEQAQWYVHDIFESFDRFLGDIGCKQTFWSEWDYACQCHGLQAKPKSEEIIYFEPDYAEHDYSDGYYGWFADVWNERVPRLTAMHEWLDRNEYHLQHAGWDYEHGYVKRKHRRFDKRFNAVYCAYESAVDDALRELCGKCEELLDAECDYAYSEEAAKDWMEAQI